ncbi:hypothetical protein FE257_004856 [Aspergillus nanangensis]|uniref:Major facilitator superfamily (MFS) profile domain-containing protein n=1 Tax=Aspergillus nanangensis TaxID=2582783 RepID=A0AAD4CAM6_ASPNN|nr:hypothetical protein FE257_004856 [Aspergillus nanangensis]
MNPATQDSMSTLEKQSHSTDNPNDAPSMEEATSLPPKYYRSIYFCGTMIACGASFASGVGGFAIAAPILNVIDADIGPSPYLLWVALSYTLTVSIGLLLIGRLSDLFGRRWFFIGGSVLGLIGCIVCAVAPNVGSLIGGTTLIGLGASSQISVIFVIAELVPMKHRFLANGFVYIWAAPFTGMGPAISYAFVVYHQSWRGCYYLMTGMNALAVVFWLLFYFPPTFQMKHPGQTAVSYVRTFDLLGLALFISGLLLFLMGLSWGGQLKPWSHPQVIATIAIGGVLLAGFACWDVYGKIDQPLVPVRLFKNFHVLWPQMVFGLYETDRIRGGLLCCLVGAGTNLGQLSSGIFGRHFGNHRWQFTIGAVVGGAFLGGMACVTPTNLPVTGALITIGSWALGYTDSIGLAMAGIVIDDQKDIGAAVGLAGCIRNTISTIGTAVYSIILTNRLAQTIPSKVPPALMSAGLPTSSIPSFLSAYATGTAEALARVPGLNDTILAAGTVAYKQASADAYRTVFFSTIAFSGVAIVFALFTADGSKMMTEDVAATLHERSSRRVVGRASIDKA